MIKRIVLYMLGVAVPCYKYHIPLLKRFFDSVVNQTKKPDFVVVSCSSSLEEDIPFFNYDLKIEILVHKERLNAAQNRNIAASRLLELGCEYISFFDCDDEMHPQRIEVIKEGFQNYPLTQIIVHSYWFHESELEAEFEIYNKIFYIENLLEKDSNSKNIKIMDGTFLKIHHSQVSVKKDLFMKVRFREEKEFERKEDTFFCSDCLSLQIPNLYIRNPLSKYYPEGKWYS